jgi:hypothetical protein
MKSLSASLVLMFVVALPGVALAGMQAIASPLQAGNLAGRWHVKLSLPSIGEKNFIFDAQAKGLGSILLLDAGPEKKPMTTPLPAVWSETTNDRVSFTSEIEFPLGTCCREMGTLIFKAKFDSTNSMSGKAIFVGSTVDEENFNGFRSAVGSFTATRIVK